MLEADDSERACIPAKLQLANFCQLRKAEIGPECVKTLNASWSWIIDVRG